MFSISVIFARMTRRERIILFLLASLNFTHFLDFMIMIPLNNYLVPYFQISAKQFTYLVSSYAISAAISGFITAFIVDNIDRKKVLLVSYAGFLVGTIGCGFADRYEILLIMRIMAGIFGGIIGAQVLAIIADTFSYERRGKAMSSVTAAFAVASILGVPFSLKLANVFHHNWHVPFLFTGAVGVILLPFAAKHIPSMASHINEGRRTAPMQLLKKILGTAPQRNALVFSCFLMIGHFLIIPFITPYLQFNKGYALEMIPTIYLAGGIASLGAAFALGGLADKKGKFPVFALSVILSLFMVLIITRLPHVPFWGVLGFFGLWFAFATGRALTAQAMISEVVAPEQRGSFMSFNGSVQQIGTGIASMAAGFIVYNDKAGKIYRYEWLGYLSILVLIIALVLGWLLFSKFDKRIEADAEDKNVITSS